MCLKPFTLEPFHKLPNILVRNAKSNRAVTQDLIFFGETPFGFTGLNSEYGPSKAKQSYSKNDTLRKACAEIICFASKVVETIGNYSK